MAPAANPKPAALDRIAAFAASAVHSPVVALETLAGDASTRRYHRVTFEGRSDPRTIVVMELPPEARGGLQTERDLPFLDVRAYLAAGGLPVPGVLGINLAEGLLALEDLGDVTFERFVSGADRGRRSRAYERAIELIAALQRLGRERRDDRCVAFSRCFDFKLLRWELDHFREWLLEVDRGAQLSEAERGCVDAGFDWLARTLADAPSVLVHRDFQSRNLMVTSVRDGEPSLTLIDFQDALLGSSAYDLVALLRDSYVELPPDEVLAHVAFFIDRCRIEDENKFRNLFYLQTAQRKLKDAGRFVFIDRVRGNPGFLRWIPTSLKYARDALAAIPELADARAVLARHVPELR